jgi:hypothetical protein
MPLIAAHEVDVKNGSPQIYNAMDSLLTAEILGELKSLLPGNNAPPELQGPKLIYDFERALQAPALEMMLRGWRIDPWSRDAGIAELRRRLTRLSFIIDAYAGAIWDQRSPTKASNDYPRPSLLNPDSTKQLQVFFYDCMKLPPIIKRKDGAETRPMDRDTLEKLESYFLARPIISAILAYRDICGQLEVLECEVDDDWRFRTSYNPAATKTGRWSSSESLTGSGRNAQNIEESLRYMFISDLGRKLVGCDYEQSESRDIGWLCFVLFDDPTYLDACESGDLHTAVARLIWPNLDWNGDPKHDRTIADRSYYRHHSYRDIAKRAGHATNYLGQAPEIARQIRVPLQLIREFQERYFSAFPSIRTLHTWVASQLQRNHYLINAFGRRRDFFGRADSSETIKQAVADLGQSTTANRTNLALWRIWKHMGPKSKHPVELLAQLHDAIYLQRNEADTDESEIVAQVQEHMNVKLSYRNRIFSVPTEPKVGWLWSSAYEYAADGAKILKHPDGLIKFTGSDTRARTSKVFQPGKIAA